MESVDAMLCFLSHPDVIAPLDRIRVEQTYLRSLAAYHADPASVSFATLHPTGYVELENGHLMSIDTLLQTWIRRPAQGVVYRVRTEPSSSSSSSPSAAAAAAASASSVSMTAVDAQMRVLVSPEDVFAFLGRESRATTFNAPTWISTCVTPHMSPIGSLTDSEKRLEHARQENAQALSYLATDATWDSTSRSSPVTVPSRLASSPGGSPAKFALAPLWRNNTPTHSPARRRVHTAAFPDSPRLSATAMFNQRTTTTTITGKNLFSAVSPMFSAGAAAAAPPSGGGGGGGCSNGDDSRGSERVHGASPSYPLRHSSPVFPSVKRQRRDMHASNVAGGHVPVGDEGLNHSVASYGSGGDGGDAPRHPSVLASPSAMEDFGSLQLPESAYSSPLVRFVPTSLLQSAAASSSSASASAFSLHSPMLTPHMLPRSSRSSPQSSRFGGSSFALASESATHGSSRTSNANVHRTLFPYSDNVDSSAYMDAPASMHWSPVMHDAHAAAARARLEAAAHPYAYLRPLSSAP